MLSGGRTRLTVLLASLGLLLWLLLSAKSSELGSNHSANIPQTKSKVNQIQAQQPLNNTSKLDPKNLRLTHSECLHHFPSLFAPITKTTQFYKTHGGVDYTDITRIYSLLRGPSNHPAFQVHVAIIANKLYIKEYRPSHPNINRALLILDHLNRIISVSPQPLSDVEFVINISDQGGEELAGPVFSLAREVGNNVAWLMPDFGFNAWPEVGVLSYDVLRDQVEDLEARVKAGSVTKVDKLFWRGAPMHFAERKEALELATNAWADIKELRWSCLSTPEKPECKGLTDHKTIPNHCLYEYLLQTEGYTYSGRFKYLLNCNSIVLTGKLEWEQHFHHLLNYTTGSPNQNIIQVSPPFKKNLPTTMESLLKNVTLQKLVRDNSWTLLRNRYLTPAATACYWRHLINEYASVMNFKPSLNLVRTDSDSPRVGAAGTGKAAPYESFVVMQKVDWNLN